MKKIFSYAMMLLAGGLAFISCEADHDSNPILETPADGSFVVNNPVYGEAQVDLQTSSAVALSWSQPKFTDSNAPLVVNYEIQLSTAGTFSQAYVDAEDVDNTNADYIALDVTYTQCNVTVPAVNIDKALEQLNGWSDASAEAFTKGVSTSIRVRAFVSNASQEVVAQTNSNIVKVNMLPYYIELRKADPDIWYLIGGDICDGKWGGDVALSVLPLQTVADYEYDAKSGLGEITWTGHLAGNGFKLKHTTDSWDEQWGQGDAFGSYVKNDGGSGNITVPSAGYYTVKLNTATDVLSIEEYTETPTVFAGMCVSGDFNGWSDTEMKPCFSFDGAVNHDWYAEVTLDGTQGIKFKEVGSWDYNTGGPVAQTAAGDLYGYGSNNGDNIYPAAGTYLVIYNDITRFYRFILK